MEDPKAIIKGRGSSRSLAGRFERTVAEPADDGWDSRRAYNEDNSSLFTQVTEEHARTVLSSNDSPDVGFNASVNPYRGCEHGCFYCFARPSHSYLDLSPGLDFETKIFAKVNARERLEEAFRKPGYRPEPIALGINTDAYQPTERRYRVTRAVLELLEETRHPVSIVTKSALITRDIDLLESLAKDSLVSVAFSVTTLDNKLSARMEPRATAPHARLAAMKVLADAGVPVSVMVAPVIPRITDHELESILEAAFENGARSAGYVLLRLPHELKALARDWLELHFPDRAGHVLSLIQQMHGGKDYRANFGTRMTGTGPFAAIIEQRFRKARVRIGYEKHAELARHHFKVPTHAGPQGDLFG